MSVYTTDTHSLVWYTLNKQAKLSPKALSVFEKADTGAAFIYIPSVVLWEVATLEQANRIKLADGFLRWSENLLAGNGFELAPLTAETVARAVAYNFNNDPFDRIIVATAAELSLPLINQRRSDHEFKFGRSLLVNSVSLCGFPMQALVIAVGVQSLQTKIEAKPFCYKTYPLENAVARFSNTYDQT